MLTKRERLISLYRDKGFVFDKFPEKMGVECKFSCPHRKVEECDVKIEKEPIWTLAMGDEDSNVLIIGEAPSLSTGFEKGGPRTAGNVAKWLDNYGQEEVGRFISFVKDNYGTFPFFTDICKCGDSSQGGKKNIEKLSRRGGYCRKHLLKEEIDIIRPDIVLCVGNFSYGNVMNERGILGLSNSEIYKMTHYCGTATRCEKGFTLGNKVNITNKVKIIWPRQANIIKENPILKDITDKNIIKTPIKSLREKQEVNNIFIPFWASLLESAKLQTTLHANVLPSNRQYVIARIKRYLHFAYYLRLNDAKVELYIDSGDRAKNKWIYDSVCESKDEIQKAFGDELKWERLDDKDACRISKTLNIGSYKNRERWPWIQKSMIDAMVRFEVAMMPCIETLTI